MLRPAVIAPNGDLPCRDEPSTISGRDKRIVRSEYHLLRAQRLAVVRDDKIGGFLRIEFDGSLSDYLLTRNAEKLFTGSIDQGDVAVACVRRCTRYFLHHY